jgi:hypothetical protein
MDSPGVTSAFSPFAIRSGSIQEGNVIGSNLCIAGGD